MSKAIYKPISWEEASELMGDKDTVEKLFIQGDNFALFNALQSQINIGCLPKQNWYLRCEQEDEFECLPEVSD